jgi:hypothetical protein
MIRDRDRIYGGIVTRRLRAMGIVVFGETHLRRILRCYARYFAISTTSERIEHWIKMRQSLARFSGPASNRSPS